MTMPQTSRYILNSGYEIPALGLGTWMSKPGEVTQAVKYAIDAGYRLFDCAFIYGNEPEIGAAVKEKIEDGTVKREDLFITSKLWNTFHSKSLVMPILKQSLKNLCVDYLDLYLIHWPMGYKEGGELFPKDENDKLMYSDADYMESWLIMQEAVKEGLVRSIGVSNFNKDQIFRICTNTEVPLSVVQVECHAYLNQSKLIEFCKNRGIVVMGYSPLGAPGRRWVQPDDPKLLEDPKILALADKYKKTPANILVRFQFQRRVIPIPKSVSKSRIESNLQIFDFELSEADMEQILSMDCNGRAIHLTWVNDHPHFPFSTEY